MRRRKWLWLIAAAAVLLAALALDARLIVREYRVEAAQITSPVRLAVIADFHGCDYGREAERLVREVEAAEPDVILLAGDIFDDDMPWEPSEALVRRLARRWPCFYVTGNHEYWSGRAEEICDIVTAAGATVLAGDGRTIDVRGQRLSICGVTDPDGERYVHAPDGQTQLARAKAAAENGAYAVLLAHRPERIAEYAAAGFDLVVSGHAHGGQVRLPGLLNGLYAPDQGFLPAYAGGAYRVGDTTLIVSRGLARESTRLPRVFNRPELVIVTLE